MRTLMLLIAVVMLFTFAPQANAQCADGACATQMVVTSVVVERTFQPVRGVIRLRPFQRVVEARVARRIVTAPFRFFARRKPLRRAGGRLLFGRCR